MREEIERLERKGREVAQRHKGNKEEIERELGRGSGKDVGDRTVESELKNLRMVLDGINNDQLMEFKSLSNQYKDLELEIRSTKRQIEKRKAKPSTTRAK